MARGCEHQPSRYRHAWVDSHGHQQAELCEDCSETFWAQWKYFLGEHGYQVERLSDG